MFQMGRWEEALNWFNRACEICPGDPEANLHFQNMCRFLQTLVVERINNGAWNSILDPVPGYLNKLLAIYWHRTPEIKIFLETGTYLGSMIHLVMNQFDKIISVELSEVLFKNAVARFQNYPNVHLVRGNSGLVLTDILCEINEPCLFWLDAHYSGESTARADLDTPILQELETILQHPVDQHVILIDDAACFEQGWKDYPSINEIESFVEKRRPDWHCLNDRGVIRIQKAPFG